MFNPTRTELTVVPQRAGPVLVAAPADADGFRQAVAEDVDHDGDEDGAAGARA